MSSGRLRVAWFSPPQQRAGANPLERRFSKSGYLSEVLLPHITKDCDVELFSAQAGIQIGDVTSRHYLTACSRDSSNKFDVFFYNLENGKQSDFCRLHLGLQPGLCWVHDFTLIDDGPEPILNSPWSWQVDAFSSRKDQLIWPTKKDEFLPVRPQALREVGMSLGVLFSSERDLSHFRALNPARLNKDDFGQFLPIPLPTPTFETKNSWPSREGRGDRALKVACCANPSVESYMHAALRAIAEFSRAEIVWLIDPEERSRCEGLLSEFGVGKAQIVEGRTPERWATVLKECDVALHMNFSFYEQMQPWLAFSLAHGVHTITLDFSEADFFPNSVAIKVAPGAKVSVQLHAIFEMLEEHSFSRNEMAMVFAREQYEASKVAAELHMVLQNFAETSENLRSRWHSFTQLGRRQLLQNNLLHNDQQHAAACSEIFQELGWQ